jgi:hypothetical protein
MGRKYFMKASDPDNCQKAREWGEGWWGGGLCEDCKQSREEYRLALLLQRLQTMCIGPPTATHHLHPTSTPRVIIPPHWCNLLAACPGHRRAQRLNHHRQAQGGQAHQISARPGSVGPHFLQARVPAYRHGAPCCGQHPAILLLLLTPHLQGVP